MAAPPGPDGKQQRLHISGPCSIYSDLAGWRALMLCHPAGRVYRSPGRCCFLGWPAWVTGPPPGNLPGARTNRWPQRGTRDTGPTSSSRTEEQRSKWPVNISYKHSHSSLSKETDRTESAVCVCARVCEGACGCVYGRNQRHFDEIWIVFPLRGASQLESLCIVISNHTFVC